MSTPLHVETIGQGPDLVLLHGWGFHGGIWQNCLQRLQQHFRLTVIDLPGFGYSQDMIIDYRLATLANTLLAVAPAQSIWLGWSLGGLLATYIARYFPERVTKLILLASNPKFIADAAWPGMTPALLDSFVAKLAQDPTTTLQQFLALQVLKCDNERQLLKQIRHGFAARPGPDLAALYQGAELLQQVDLRTELAALPIDVLSIMGTLDSLVPVRVASALTALNPRLECAVIKGAAHAPFLSHPELCLTHIEQFGK